MSYWDKKAREKRIRSKTFPSDHMHSPYWCERHWAPYRVRNADGVLPNGLMAAALLSERFLQSVEYLELTDKSADALNKHMRAAKQPLCCRLGDVVMDEVLAIAIERGDK